MKRITSILFLGAAFALGVVQLAGCDDDTTVNVSPHDAGGEGGEGGKGEGGAEGGATGHDAAPGTDAAAAADAADGD